MTIQLPERVLNELDKLFIEITSTDEHVRSRATSRLIEFEKSGKIPLSALFDMLDEKNPVVVMYALGALGRNKSSEAVKKLTDMLGHPKAENILITETIVDALGETGQAEAAAPLLELLGLQTGLKKLLGSLVKKKKEPESKEAKSREYLTLPVIRALEKISEPKSVEQIGSYLDHEDSLVRWHTLRALVGAKVTSFNDKVRQMSESDADEVVRDMAGIAIGKLAPLPNNLNN
ncbi:MAG: HEAT repeat domain-containing protein [Deltaproteobacteria bacterium]|nr:HEAT repeat domain-containing protein [Deltaproteobacteria bacterium]